MFNKEKFAELLNSAKGNNRSLNQFAYLCGISPAHISRYMRKILPNPPNPKLLQKIAQVSEVRVTYEELMDAAGYFTVPYAKSISTKMRELYAIIVEAADLNDENIEIVSEILEIIIKKLKARQNK